jgi:hypothetical protein
MVIGPRDVAGRNIVNKIDVLQLVVLRRQITLARREPNARSALAGIRRQFSERTRVALILVPVLMSLWVLVSAELPGAGIVVLYEYAAQPRRDIEPGVTLTAALA